jgi:uncharacterized membrane protein required for colicin V production
MGEQAVIVYGVPLFDLAFIALLICGFVVGFVQGVIRRMLGIAAISFSFLLAASLRGPVGSLLASNWTTMSAAYVEMLAFLGLFVVLSLGTTVAIQGFYHRTPAFEDKEWLDELIGGVLGVIQMLLLVGMVLIILDSYFRATASALGYGEIRALRQAYDGIDLSETARFYRDVLIPVGISLAGPFIPPDIQRLFAR